MILKVGDTVLYGKYSGTEVTYAGTSYIIMKQSEILAVVEKQPLAVDHWTLTF